jgi:hypothetical protein
MRTSDDEPYLRNVKPVFRDFSDGDAARTGTWRQVSENVDDEHLSRTATGLFSISRRAPARTAAYAFMQVFLLGSHAISAKAGASPHDSPRRRLHCHDVMTS